MRVSEKTLELNIGAELLTVLRARKGFEKLYLRGLTQAQERRDGADFFAYLSPKARIFAFQFKAPKDIEERSPYRYRLVRHQHECLLRLARMKPRTVFYVFPYFTGFDKVHRKSPTLLAETRFLEVSTMESREVFSSFSSRTISCTGSLARVNPEFTLESFPDLHIPDEAGVNPGAFGDWFGQSFPRSPVGSSSAENELPTVALSRGLYFAVSPGDVQPNPDVQRAR